MSAQPSLLPDFWRLFVAATLPEPAPEAVWTALAPLRGAHPSVRWMRPEQLHLTLVFLGQTDASRVRDIVAALQRVAAGHARYGAATGDAGGRVDERPNARRGGVAWLRLATGGPETAALALDVDGELGSRTYDERRSPRPHLTVARNVDAPVLEALRKLAPSLRLAWSVEEVVLFRSHTGPGGSRYERLATFELP